MTCGDFSIETMIAGMSFMIIMMIVYLTGRPGKGRSADQSAYWLPNGWKWWDAKGIIYWNYLIFLGDDTF